MGTVRGTVGIALAAHEPEPSHLIAQLESINAQTLPAEMLSISLDPGFRFPHWESVWTASPELRAMKDRLGRGARWVCPPSRLGIARNFAYAAEFLDGVDAIAFSDQDDVWHPEKLRASLARLNECPPLSAVHCDMWVWDGSSPRSTDLPKAWTIERRGVKHVEPLDLCIRNVVAGAGMLIDAELVRRFPAIPDAFAFHDHWFAAIASLHGGVHALSLPLYWYQQHPGGELGVTPYVGMTSRLLRSGAATLSIARDKWQETKARAEALNNAVAPSDCAALARILKTKPSVSLLARGCTAWRDSDVALARASWIRALGSIL